METKGTTFEKALGCKALIVRRYQESWSRGLQSSFEEPLLVTLATVVLTHT